MKYLIKTTLLLALFTMLFSACNDDDDYSLDKYWVSYGTVQGDGHDYKIMLDDGSSLNLVASLIPQYHPKNNQRVIANYTILGDNVSLEGKSYSIRLNNIYEVLSKAPVKQSFIDQNQTFREDSIGHDPIDVEDAWFSGKYLNVNFNVAVSGRNDVRHFINLVQNDMTVSAESEAVVELTLRHNAYNDQRNYVGFGRVSFDISSILPEGATSVNVRLKWTQYDGEEKSDTGTFTMGAGGKEPKSKLKVDKIATIVE